MISSKLTKALEKEGLERGFIMESAGGAFGDDGRFRFVITLLSNAPPPALGIHVSDGLAGADKVGG